MKSFKEYLTESKKTYDFRIKIAGDLPEGADAMMKTALEKYGVEAHKKLSSTMVQEHPLDFPMLKNMSVTVFETSLNYPTTQEVLRDYLCDYLDINHTNLKVKKPGEPTEEYQETKTDDYETKLTDGEYKDAPKTDPEASYGDKYNMTMLKALMDDDAGPKEDRQAKPVGGESKEDMKGMQTDPEGGPSPMGNKASHTNSKKRGEL